MFKRSQISKLLKSYDNICWCGKFCLFTLKCNTHGVCEVKLVADYNILKTPATFAQGDNIKMSSSQYIKENLMTTFYEPKGIFVSIGLSVIIYLWIKDWWLFPFLNIPFSDPTQQQGNFAILSPKYGKYIFTWTRNLLQWARCRWRSAINWGNATLKCKL